MRRRMLVPLILSGALTCASSAGATPGDCIKIDNDLDRLACYDAETGRTPKKESIAAPKGAWIVQRSTSNLTDQTNVFMSLMSNETVDCGWNKGEKIQLLIMCRENTTSWVFSTGCHMASSDYNDYGDITYRLDTDKARTVRGEESTNNRSLGLWKGRQAIPVIKQMLDKTTMIVRMTPFSENPFTANFNISGLKESISPLRKACGW